MKQLQVMQQEHIGEKVRELVLDQLTEKQKVILRRVSCAQSLQSSRFVKILRKELQCSDSILWKGIRFLREKELLERSESIALTPLGRWIVEGEHDKERWLRAIV